MTITGGAASGAYSPANYNAKVGETVVWRNSGSTQHTVTSANLMLNSGNISTNGTFQFTFQNAGVYEYFCTRPNHDMEGTITVQP